MLGRAIILLTAVLCCFTTQVNALGLGEVTLESTLNQPLQARIELLDLGDARAEDIEVGMASVGDFERFNIDRSRFISNIKFSIESASGRNYVVLSSSQVVREPYLSFILDTRWPSGRLLSEHTLLLDLPVFDDQQETAAPALPVSQSASFSASSDSAPATDSSNNLPVAADSTPAPVARPVTSTPIQNPAPAAPVAAIEPLIESVQAIAEPEPVVQQTVEQIAQQTTDSIDAAPVEVAAAVAEIAEQVSVADSGNAEIQRLAEAISEAAEPIPDNVEISASDTLWGVALRVRPNDSVSVQQTMLAIQRLNPDAFAEGNINRLLSGEVIRVPDLSEIRSVDQEQAIAEVSRQNQATGIGVEPLIAPANGPSSQNRTQQGQLSVVSIDSSTENSTNAAGPLAEENAELDRRIVDLENRLALSQENSDRAEIEREELSSRLGSIELQIDSAREILDLQDLQLAQLQQSLGDAASNPIEVAQTETEQDDDAPVDAAVAAAAAQTAASTPAGPGTSQPGFLENLLATLERNLIIAGAGLGLVVLGLVLLMLRRNRDDEFEEVAMAGAADENFAAVDGEALAQASADEVDTLDDSLKELQVDTAEAGLDDLVDLGADLEEDVLQEVSAELNAGEIEAIVDESVSETTEDVLEKVAVFTQYKQFDEAKDLLVNRLETEPDNAHLRLQLAEIFAEQQDQSAFAEQEEKLSAGADTVIIAALAELKEKFVASEADLYLSDEVDELAAFDVEAAQSESATVDLDSEDSDQETLSVSDLESDTEQVEESDRSFDAVEFSSDASSSEESDASGSIEEVDEEIAELSNDDNELESFSFDLEKVEGDSDTETAEVQIAEETAEDVSVDFNSKEAIADDADVVVDQDQLDAVAEDTDSVATDNMVEFELAEDGSEDTESSETTETNLASTTADDADEKTDQADGLERTDDTESVRSEASSDVSDDSDEIESFDFELDSPEGDTVVEKPMFSADAGDESSADDFDFDLDEFEVDGEVSSAADLGTDLDLDEEIKELDMELSDEDSESTSENQDTDAIDFDLNSAMDFATEVKTDTSDKPDYSGGELDNLEFTAGEEDSQLTDSSDSDFGDMDMLSEDDEAATKLELAYAYQKMGDDSGAREILEEIITEGNGPQITEAKELLNSLGTSK